MTMFASLQWLFFIFANTVVVPISVGTAFELPQHEIAAILRSSFIITGIACMLQGLIGHRFPLMEGHSGVMWGLMLNLSVTASSLGMSLSSIGGGIATGMLLAGAVVFILGALNLLTFLHKVFTPMVMSVYLFLLTFQLIQIFFEGMIKVSHDGTVDVPVSLFSIGIVILVSLLKIKGPKSISNFSILIGMIVGWIFYIILFPQEEVINVNANTTMDILIFPFGTPNLHIGIISVTFLASFINLINTNASIQTVANLLNAKITKSHFNRSYLLTGMYSILAAIFGLVSYAPFTSSVGFLESTQIFDRKPFIIGGGLLSLMGVIPFLGALFASMPITVGNAVLFVAYLQLFGTSLKSLNGYLFNSVTIHRLAIPVLVGLSIMNMETELFRSLPAFLQPIVSNGFIMGVLISIVMEALVKWDREMIYEKDM